MLHNIITWYSDDSKNQTVPLCYEWKKYHHQHLKPWLRSEGEGNGGEEEEAMVMKEETLAIYANYLKCDCFFLAFKVHAIQEALLDVIIKGPFTSVKQSGTINLICRHLSICPIR